MPSPPATKTVALYGGALHVDVPASYVDVSALREVPDHQEVYADAAATDACVIVELLSTPADGDSPSLIPAAASPAAFHWRQLAADADAVAAALRREAPLPPGDMPSMVASVAAVQAAAQAGGGGGGGGGARPFGGVPPAVDASVATGHHTVAKFREAASDANLVEVSVGCFRLPHVTTDLLVIVNDPLVIAPGSSSAAAGARGGVGGGAGGAFALALRTLRVDDWSLFCDD